ncbi:MAG TPA: PhzF family phenazine biosynthesis isomerase [Gaiellales bacterium]|jgi:PhzF family phenazine biosynthesis protein
MELTAARVAAFSDDPRGGNPAGVVVGHELPPDATMQSIAKDVGYSETVFLAGDGGSEWTARYFSPEAEVPFCGHATIAAAIALYRQFGTTELAFDTAAGQVPIAVDELGGRPWATLTSVAPHVAPLGADLLAHLLLQLHLSAEELDPRLPPMVAYAGAYHPIIALATRASHAALTYDFDGLRALMEARDWTTIQIVWRASETQFRARNPFPVGGVVEDPATGAAAAAFGAYLRELGAVTPPASIEIVQGEEIGRPSQIFVAIPREGGIGVTGTAVLIPSALA